jgi:hypothetical protein
MRKPFGYGRNLESAVAGNTSICEREKFEKLRLSKVMVWGLVLMARVVVGSYYPVALL